MTKMPELIAMMVLMKKTRSPLLKLLMMMPRVLLLRTYQLL